MGREHAAAAAACGDEVRWVVDSDARAAASLAELYGAAAPTDLDELLTASSPDVVVIATPSDQHLTQALRCAGIPTLLEKPPWLADQDARPLLAAVKRERGLVAVGMTTRFDPAIATVYSAVITGKVGSVLSVHDAIHFVLRDDDFPTWYHQSHHRGGGVVQTNGVHALDRVSWVLGELPRLVTARAGSTARRNPIEDCAWITLTTQTVSVHISLLWSRYQPPSSSLQVIGTLGTATAFADGSWEVTTSDGTERGPATPGTNNYLTQWQAFRSAVTGGLSAPSIPMLADLVGPMNLLTQIIESLEQPT